MGDYLKKRYGFKSTTIFPPSISQEKVYFKKKFFRKKLFITTVCRLSKEKNIQDIIYAIKYLNQKNIILNIIGEGPEKKNLLELGKKLNIFKQIKFLGHKKNVFRYLSRTDLYVNSSYFEGFPNSVVEAAHMGIPVISSQSHGGINEILLRGKCGTIYKNDYFDLASKIKKFYNNPKAFYQKASLAKKNVKKFNVNNHIRRFEKLLNKI